MASVVKDKKGNTFFVSHIRCGVTEGVFLTFGELLEVRDQINDIVRYEQEKDLAGVFEEGAG